MSESPPLPESRDSLLNPTIITESGHVLKNVGLVEQINAKREIRLEAIEFYSWQCSRIVRRDFNILTRRMYLALASGRDWRDKSIRSLMQDVSLSGETFLANCQRYKLTRDLEMHTSVSGIRLISAEATVLYKTFMAVDDGMRRLACAVSDGKINNDVRSRLFQQFEEPYFDLKSLVMHSKMPGKSADDLADEMGLG